MEPQTLVKALDLVRKIDALGGPPPHRADTYRQLREQLKQADLGFPFLIAGGVIAGGMLLSFLGLTLWETQKAASEAGRKLIETTTTAGRVLIWTGVAWLAWQAMRKA